MPTKRRHSAITSKVPSTGRSRVLRNRVISPIASPLSVTTGNNTIPMPSDSSSTITLPPLQSVSSLFQGTDYHSHPNIPNWVLDITKRLDANEAKLLQFDKITAQNKELIASLHTAQSRIAELELKLAGVTSSSNPVTIATQTIPTVTPTKSVSFSDVVTTSTSPSYAGIASVSPRPIRFVSKKAAARSFLPVSSSQGFQFLYIFSRGKEPYNVIRSKLSKLGIASNRVLDIHYPTNQVLALLVHNDYASTVTDIFQKSGVTLKTDFNPLSPSIIKDPRLSSLSEKEKATKATDIHQKRLCNTVKRITSPTVRPALANTPNDVFVLSNPNGV